MNLPRGNGNLKLFDYRQGIAKGISSRLPSFLRHRNSCLHLPGEGLNMRICRGAPSASRTGGSSEKGQEGEEGPSLATRLSRHEALVSEPRNHNAARWSAHFRFALKNRASLQCALQRQPQPQQGDISIELVTGTFLKSLDTAKPSRCR